MTTDFDNPFEDELDHDPAKIHDDLIGVTVPLLDGSSCFLIVTGTSANPAYVDVEKRNQHGDFIGRSCRPAAYVRQYRRNERSVGSAS